MTENQKTTTPVVPETSIIEAGYRRILVVGSDLVSLKFLALAQALMDFIADGKDIGVNSIVFRDDDMPQQLGKKGKAEPILAAVDWASGAISINLEETFTRAFESTAEFDNLSVYPVYWHNMLLNVTHEVVHLLQMLDADEPKGWIRQVLEDDDFRAQAEKDCQAETERLLTEFIKTVECEPPAYGEETYFANCIGMAYSAGDGADKQAIEWLDNRVFIMGEVDGKPKPITDFRGYMAVNSDHPDCDSWNGELINVLPFEGVNVAPPANTYAATVEETTMPAENAEATLAEDEVDVVPEESGPEGTIASNPIEFFNGGGGMAAAPGPVPSIPAAGPAGIADNVVASFATPTAAPAAPAAAPAFVPAAQAQPAAVQQTPFVAAGGGGATQQMQPVAEVYPNHNLTPEDVQARFYGVCNKIFEHIFTPGEKHCQMGGVPEGYGPQHDIKAFGYPKAVVDFPIALTPQEMELVVKCEVLNAMGQREVKLTSDGLLQGWETNNELPCYMLHLNVNGQDVRRMVVPQNPNKRNPQTQQLSKPAMAARNGQRILWVFEGNDALGKANPSTRMKSKCVEGQWERINA